jgi:hypothetical protein
MVNSQVLQVSTREWNVGHHLDLAITNLRDVDGVAQVTDAAIDLDLVMEELFESGQIKDLVADRLGAVDGVLEGGDVSNQIDWRLRLKQAIS